MREHCGCDTVSSYEALFASRRAQEAVVRVEGSTTYLYSATAVPSILAAVPDARFIVAVRNPADLLISYHRTQLVAMNECERDFDRAWRRSLQGQLPPTDPLDAKLLDYPTVGGLGAAVSTVPDRVGRDRVHVVATPPGDPRVPRAEHRGQGQVPLRCENGAHAPCASRPVAPTVGV